MKTTGTRWAAFGAMGLTVALAGGAMAAAPAAGKPKPKTTGVIKGEALPGEAGPRPGSRLDVVFVIDSTGSMGGIIEDGKREMRKIVDEIQAGDPKPDLRVGLVTYRDVGDDYITKHVPLSRDFDNFYKFMNRIVADAGADWEEHVSKAMHVAVSKLNWDLDKNTARMIFLIGDAPGHTDYTDGFDYKKEAEIARDKKIVINAFAMNDDAAVKAQWEHMAKVTGGLYKVIGYGSGAGTYDGDSTYEEHDYSGDGAAPATGAPKSGLGKSVTEAVKSAAEKKGTTYAKPPKAPAPKKAPK